MATEKVARHPGIFRDTERGTYGYTVEVPTADGRRRQLRRRGFLTVKAAEAEWDARRGEARTGRLVTPRRLTLARFLVDTWLPMTRQRVRETTFDGYRRSVDRHIVPALGSHELQSLSRASVASWVTDLQAKGLAAKTTRNVHGVLVKALDDAQELGLVSGNVASRLRHLPAAPSPKVKAWTVEQMQSFFANVRDERWFTLWRFLAVSGCRRGEALGLKWSDLDLEAGVVTIARQRTIAGGRLVEGPPKTSSGFRTIALDPAMIAAFRTLRAQQLEERLAAGGGWRGDDWVFCWQTGEPLWPQTVTSWFRQHCRRLDLPQIGPHGLRHTAATFLIARGESPRVVQQRLGHADVGMTLRLYSHVLPGHDQAAADALGSAIDG